MTSRWFWLLLRATFKPWRYFHWRFEYVLPLWCHFTEPEAKICKNAYFIVPLKRHLTFVLIFENKTAYLIFFFYPDAVNSSSSQDYRTHMSSLDETPFSLPIVCFFSYNETNLPMSSCFLATIGIWLVLLCSCIYRHIYLGSVVIPMNTYR